MRIKPIIKAMLVIFALERASAAPILSNLLPFNPPLESIESASSEPSLALNLLGRLGVRMTYSSLDASRLRLQLGDSRVDYSDSSGWLDMGGAALDLPSPETLDGQTVVPLRVLGALGVKLSVDAAASNLTSQGAINLEFVNVLPPGGFNQVVGWQATRRPNQVGLKDRKSTRLNSSHRNTSRMPSSA